MEGQSQDSPVDIAESQELTVHELPEIALVKIMDYLNLRERYSLSQTCQLFYELFSHPHLWRRARICLMIKHGGQSHTRSRATWKFQTFMPRAMTIIVQRFAHLFQHLTLELQGLLQPFDEDSVTLLTLLASNCRLESFVLKLGPLPSCEPWLKHELMRQSNLCDLPMVVALVKNAYKLKHLAILSWPLQDSTGDDKDIYAAMMSNRKLESLISLNLFAPVVEANTWTDRIPTLPTPQLTIQLVQALPNLAHLSLRSLMLSSDLLIALASHKRSPLLTFRILAQGVTLNQPPLTLTSHAWQTLHKTWPSLKVEVVLFNRVHESELRPLLQTEARITNMVINTFGRCDAELIFTLSEGHKNSLRRFVSYSESSSCDEALLYLVKVCTLTSLVYHGEVHYTTVEKIASLMMNQIEAVKVLEFSEKNIKTQDIMAENNSENDMDIVVAVDAASRELYLPGLRAWHQDERVRHTKLKALISHVSECLGSKWMPV